MIIEGQKIDKKGASILKEYYARYLTEVKGRKMSTVKHYFNALNTISKRLKEKQLLNDTIYEVGDLERLEELKEILKMDSEFVALDERGNRMYTAGLNNYLRFAKGLGFTNPSNESHIMDIPIKSKESITVTKTIWNRSGIIKEQVLALADYSCEIDNGHESFLAEKNQKPYMEGHHAIPMRLQDKFENSLDVYANIVCLCPICHRKIHYGIRTEKEEMINMIYSSRVNRLIHSGIEVSREEFRDLVI